MERSVNSLFLLGGYDLEMVTIRELLLANGFTEIHSVSESNPAKCFADRKLAWGAKLSAYASLLSYNGDVYGVELTEDFAPPPNYIRIDHHNEFSYKTSSLEQVAELLKVELDRYGTLVAANDKGYIPAMKAMQASEEEIRQIRRADRQAQGVSEEDERLAEESIRQSLLEEDGITVIKSLSEKFSPITDNLYGKAGRLLIHTDSKLVYYGKGAGQLAKHFDGLIKERKAYAGGGDEGYFGLAEGAFDKNKLNELIPEIKMVTTK